MGYQEDMAQSGRLIRDYDGTWDGISSESIARMRAQNKFRTGLDVARYTARIMRADMAAYDADPANYTQSLGCWHGFIAQQKIISIKKHFGTTKGRYIYLSGWMIAALRSEFGPLPDQSMHEKTSVPALIEEIYTFLRQADARELGGLFRELDAARAEGDEADNRIRTFQRDSAKRAGIFHHLITLPTYHTAALSTDNLAKEYFGDEAMLGYVKGVQRAEIRQGIACVKHQNMSGSDIGDDHKEYFAGEAALKAAGKDNTMNQFAA